MTGRQLLFHVLIIAAISASVSSAVAQEAAADKAKVLLAQGIADYKALNFQDAQTSLLQASDIIRKNKSALSDAERKQLEDYLAHVPNAIRKQAAAMEAYRAAERSLAAGDLDDAVSGFAKASTSEFLNPAMRRDAQAQLALAQKRKQVMSAATAAPGPAATAPMATPAPVPAEPKAAPVIEKPAVKAAVAPAPAPAPTVVKPAVEVAAAPVAKPMPTPAPVIEKPAVEAAPAPAPARLDPRQERAKALMAKGKALLDGMKFNEAATAFQAAKQLDPDLAEVDQLLSYASRMSVQKSASESGILSRLERREAIARQAALVEINKQVRQAREILSVAEKAGDFTNAEQAGQGALDTLQANRQVFGAVEHRNQEARIRDLISQISSRREAFNRGQARKESEDIERIKAKRVFEQQQAKIRKIATLTERAKALRAQQKYDQALEVVDEILLVDSDNPWAEGEKQTLMEFSVLVRDVSLQKQFRNEEVRSLSDIREMGTPWWHYVRYPKNWKQLTEDRKEFVASAAGETEADAALRDKLKREIERLSFADIDFRDVITFLKEYSDANIHVNWRALQQAGIEPSTKVTVDVRKVTVKRALDLVLKDVSGAGAGAGPESELRYVVDGGVLLVSTKADLAREPICRVYDVRDLLVPVPDFEGPRIQLSQATQVGTEDSSSSEGIFDSDTTDSDSREKQMTKEELMKDFISLIRNSIDRESWADPQAGPAPGTPGFVQILSGSLVVTQTAQNHQALSELIEKLREAKTIQILIEARFITVDNSFLSSVGVDVDFYFNLGSNLSQSDPATVDPWTGATVPGHDGSAWGDNVSGTNHLSPVGASQDSISFINGINTGTGSNIGAAVSDVNPALSIGGTFLDDIQVDFLIQATQARSTTRQLTAPRITLSNAQRAYVTVARQQAYISDYEASVSSNTTAYEPVIDYIPTGSTLDVAATASADRRYVMMTIRPQVCIQEGQPRILYIGFDPNNPTEGQSLPIELPTVVSQQIETTVSCPDGGTLLLGGMATAAEAEREMGAPILSKVPIINRMFDNRAQVRDERTLLILVKPKIIINESAERDERLWVEEPRTPL